MTLFSRMAFLLMIGVVSQVAVSGDRGYSKADAERYIKESEAAWALSGPAPGFGETANGRSLPQRMCQCH
jgi:hypothetical protein